MIDVTAGLIAAGGREAANTRAVAADAAVQAPTIYRLFGDKRGLLDAVAEASLAHCVAEKSTRRPLADPVRDLREGWDLHVAFGLAYRHGPHPSCRFPRASRSWPVPSRARSGPGRNHRRGYRRGERHLLQEMLDRIADADERRYCGSPIERSARRDREATGIVENRDATVERRIVSTLRRSVAPRADTQP
jgi:AcrR family transcriptional regulator